MLRKLAVFFLWTLFASQPAHALFINFTADIEGSQEVPARESLAFGTGVFTFDDVANRLSFRILFTDALCTPTNQGGCLDTPEIMAHIHGPARTGVNADILFPLPLDGLKVGAIDITTNPAAVVADLLAGLWYVNIHTDEHPGGEIRGQILPVGVPEPMGAVLMLVGVAGLVWSGRRR
jgi:hypothetical protein